MVQLVRPTVSGNLLSLTQLTKIGVIFTFTRCDIGCMPQVVTISHMCELVFGMQILYKCLFRIIFGVQKKNMVYFCRFYRCFYFICGIIWIVDRFMLLVYMYFGDKESISLDVDLY